MFSARLSVSEALAWHVSRGFNHFEVRFLVALIQCYFKYLHKEPATKALCWLVPAGCDWTSHGTYITAGLIVASCLERKEPH